MNVDWNNPDTIRVLRGVMRLCQISEEQARPALLATGGLSEDRAIEWLSSQPIRSDLEIARAALEANTSDPRAEAIYEEGRQALNDESDARKAFELFREAAKLGHLESVNNVGKALHFGAGADRNQELAALWFALAVERGEKKA